MRCLLDGSWDDSSLDFHRPASSYRIQVLAFANVETMEGMYFVLPRSAKLIWNYIREVGAVETWRKIASRLQERNRNQKFQSFGLGRVVEIVDDPHHSDRPPVARDLRISNELAIPEEFALLRIKFDVVGILQRLPFGREHRHCGSGATDFRLAKWRQLHLVDVQADPGRKSGL